MFHGTPAGGAGINGCLEAGSSVVALCYDELHRSLMQRCVLERAVEATARGTTLVFKDTALQDRGSHLNILAPKPIQQAAEAAAGSEPKPRDEGEEGKKAKKTKKTEKKPKKIVESSSSDESEDGDDEEEEAPVKKRARK